MLIEKDEHEIFADSRCDALVFLSDAAPRGREAQYRSYPRG